jgi:hypothetical protein
MYVCSTDNGDGVFDDRHWRAQGGTHLYIEVAMGVKHGADAKYSKNKKYSATDPVAVCRLAILITNTQYMPCLGPVLCTDGHISSTCAFLGA